MMRCIAVDDEPLALRQIGSYIDRTPFLETTALCHNAFEAVEVLSGGEADLMFVDINMPDLSGLDFVRSLARRPMIVFTTAYSEYALEGFRVDALDYLLKPIGYPDFLRAAEKAYRQFRLAARGIPPPATPDTIYIKSDYKQIQVNINDIISLESRSEYVRIYTAGGKPLMTLGSLRSFEERLPAGNFMRVHRSHIVNLSKISAVERNVIIIGDMRIPVGEQYRDRFREYLDSHNLFA